MEKSKAKRKVGRPTKYTDEMPQKLMEAMNQGKSVQRFCRDIQIDTDTFYEWVKVHPEFTGAFKKGRCYCEAHWEDWLVNHFDDKNVNSGLVKLFMANRFGWREKTDTNHSVKILSQEEALNQLE